MPRPRTGNTYLRGHTFHARITLAPNLRPSIALPTCHSATAAESRARLLASLAERLRSAGRPYLAPQLIRNAAAAAEGPDLDAILHTVDLITGAAEPARVNLAPTIRELGERWTRGDLAREFPDHIKPKSSADHDAGRLELHVYPLVGDVSIDRFTLDHADAVKRAIPAKRACLAIPAKRFGSSPARTRWRSISRASASSTRDRTGFRVRVGSIAPFEGIRFLIVTENKFFKAA